MRSEISISDRSSVGAFCGVDTETAPLEDDLHLRMMHCGRCTLAELG